MKKIFTIVIIVVNIWMVCIGCDIIQWLLGYDPEACRYPNSFLEMLTLCTTAAWGFFMGSLTSKLLNIILNKGEEH